ncbi:hypothetical protein FB45DRAFT_410802 [Roridomyces roridus]|uniref:Uncharacterized protein n=1 Tax=Roridomyces roridus TaxID=1738132 RepID=A0AAD7C4E8_9AGAR|nr:hypothetical protein FB45DRAFT_410802 [Roridomyces roridus]
MLYDMVSPLSELASGRRPADQRPLAETTPDADHVRSTHTSHPRQESSHRSFSPPRRTESGTYYIVPAGANIVFQDAAGNEITRVGDFSGRRHRVSPIVVQDEHGRESYQYAIIPIHAKLKHETQTEEIKVERVDTITRAVGAGTLVLDPRNSITMGTGAPNPNRPFCCSTEVV